MNCIEILRIIKKNILLQYASINPMIKAYNRCESVSEMEYLSINNTKYSRYVSIPKKTLEGKEEYIDIENITEFCGLVRNAVLVPESDALLCGNEIYSPKAKYDILAKRSINNEFVYAESKKCVYSKKRDCIHMDGSYIDLCVNGGNNIWHLFFEMLSKFEVINNNNELSKCTLLLDKKIEKNGFAQKYISELNINGNPIMYVDNGYEYEIDKLYYISPAYLFMCGEKQSKDIFYVSTGFIQYVRKIICDKLIVSDKYKKIVIKRGDSRLENEAEVIDLLTKKGFCPVQPEVFDFYEELGLFAGAEVVVGSVGAAFTNIAYCSPNCKIVCIAPVERVGLVSSYAMIASEINASLYWCEAKLVSDLHCGTPGMTFSADMDALDKLI